MRAAQATILGVSFHTKLHPSAPLSHRFVCNVMTALRVYLQVPLPLPLTLAPMLASANSNHRQLLSNLLLSLLLTCFKALTYRGPGSVVHSEVVIDDALLDAEASAFLSASKAAAASRVDARLALKSRTERQQGLRVDVPEEGPAIVCAIQVRGCRSPGVARVVATAVYMRCSGSGVRAARYPVTEKRLCGFLHCLPAPSVIMCGCGSLTGAYTVFFTDNFFRIAALYSAVATLAHSKLPVTVFCFLVVLLAAAISLGTDRTSVCTTFDRVSRLRLCLYAALLQRLHRHCARCVRGVPACGLAVDDCNAFSALQAFNARGRSKSP